MTQNPAQHARVAADALARLVTDVQSGRAGRTHPTAVRQAIDDLIRLSDAMATALQQMPATLTQQPTAPPGAAAAPARQCVEALLLAGRAQASAAQHLRQARRAMR
jgi:glutamine synthetase adenylyltransferase